MNIQRRYRIAFLLMEIGREHGTWIHNISLVIQILENQGPIYIATLYPSLIIWYHLPLASTMISYKFKEGKQSQIVLANVFSTGQWAQKLNLKPGLRTYKIKTKYDFNLILVVSGRKAPLAETVRGNHLSSLRNHVSNSNHWVS